MCISRSDIARAPRLLVRTGRRVGVLELERLLVQHRLARRPRVQLPRGDVREVLVVAQRLAVLGLVLLAEVAAARFVAVQRVAAPAARRTRGSRRRGRPSRATGCASRSRRAPARSSRTPRGSRGSPQSALVRLCSLRAMPQLSHSTLPSWRWMSSTVRLPLIDSSRRTCSSTAASASANAGSSVGTAVCAEQRREVVADRVRQHEVAVGETLHQRGRAEPVGAVVGEVRLARARTGRARCSSGCSRPRARPSCSGSAG